jgi:cytochrome c oxidase subunit 2
MNIHFELLLLFLVLACIIAAVFYLVYLSSKTNTETGGMVKASKKRLMFLLFLAAATIILLSVTIPKSPYFLFANATPAKVVFVGAQQFTFTMSYQAIDPKNPGMGSAIELPVNEPVEFRVTSFDVNHGFAIYNDKAELIAQTQAMPGYVNRLRWEFDKPGIYNILCLEFCGAGHAIMKASFTVK